MAASEPLLSRVEERRVANRLPAVSHFRGADVRSATAVEQKATVTMRRVYDDDDNGVGDRRILQPGKLGNVIDADAEDAHMR